MNESQQPHEDQRAPSDEAQSASNTEAKATPIDTVEGSAVSEAVPTEDITATGDAPAINLDASDAVNAAPDNEAPVDPLPTTQPLIVEAPAHPVDFTFSGELSDGVTRPLTQDAAVELQGLAHVIFSQATDVGRVRPNNQDAVFSFFSTGRTADDIPDFGLFVVADGLGGHQDGEKASALSTRTIAQYVLKHLYTPMLLGEREYDQPINEMIADAMLKAHTEIQMRVPRGSTTCSAVVLIGDIAYIAHVGDSRIYLVHKGSMEQLTRDHSVVQRLIELDHITPDEAAAYQNRNYLYRALGQNEDLEIDTLRRRLPANSRLVLCSDGLWGQVGEPEILDVLKETENLQEACFRLISMANMRGGADNVSVSILQLPK